MKNFSKNKGFFDYNLITKGFFMKRKFMNFFVLFLGMSGLLLPSSCKLESFSTEISTHLDLRYEVNQVKQKVEELKFTLVGEEQRLPLTNYQETVTIIYEKLDDLDDWAEINKDTGVFKLKNRGFGPKTIKFTVTGKNREGETESKTSSAPLELASAHKIVEHYYEKFIEGSLGLELKTAEGKKVSTELSSWSKNNDRTDVFSDLNISFYSSAYSSEKADLDKWAALGLKIEWKKGEATTGYRVINQGSSLSTIPIKIPVEPNAEIAEITAQLVLQESGSTEVKRSNKTKTWYVNILPPSQHPAAKARAKEEAKNALDAAQIIFDEARARFKIFERATAVMNPESTDGMLIQKGAISEEVNSVNITIAFTENVNNGTGKLKSIKQYVNKCNSNRAAFLQELADAQSAIEEIDILIQLQQKPEHVDIQAKATKAFGIMQQQSLAIEQAVSSVTQTNQIAEAHALEFDEQRILGEWKALKDNAFKALKDAANIYVPYAQEYALVAEKYIEAYKVYEKSGGSYYDSSSSFSDAKSAVSEASKALNAANTFDVQSKLNYYFHSIYVKAYVNAAQTALNKAKAHATDSDNQNKQAALALAQKNYDDISAVSEPLTKKVDELKTAAKKYLDQMTEYETKAKTAADQARKTLDEAYTQGDVIGTLLNSARGNN